MLVLSRKIGERVVVDDNIIVTVISVRGKNVRLGFEAPKDVRIDRSEVRDRIDRSDVDPRWERKEGC